VNDKKLSPGCFGKILRVLGIFILAFVLLLAALSINQNVALARTRKLFPARGKLIKVESHLMHIDCQGVGSPTVVIDVGNSSFSIEWTLIQKELSQTTRVCTFDRPGYGWSEPGPLPRDGARVVSELHQLLQASGEKGPFLLVGHSLGGVHTRIFAAKYPRETAGMVLVDTAFPLEVSPELENQMRSSIGFYQAMNLLTRTGVLRILGPLGGQNSIPATARKLPADLRNTYLNLLLDPNQYTTAISEMEQLPQTFRQASQLLAGDRPFGDLPLIVLTAGQMSAPGSTPFNEHTIPVPDQQIALQLEMTNQSSRGEQRVVAQSGHSVHLDAPEEVIHAVHDLVQRIRKTN
jgi:pimeloyl-ACP methyl ester carboxylesterase